MDELKGAKEVVREQYKDFIRGSGFRQTLLCRNEIELAPDLLFERVPQLYASCDAAPQENSGGGEATPPCSAGREDRNWKRPIL